MVYITAHKYTTSQTQIRISSCNIPVIGMRRTHMGTAWKWVNCQIGTAQTPQSSCKHHHVFLFLWVCPGLGPRSITFSCVCVSPSVSITLCVSPVCPSPPCFERPASKYLALYTLKAFLWGQSSFRNPQTKQRRKHNQDKKMLSQICSSFVNIHCQSGYTFNSGTSSPWRQNIHEADQS